MKSNFCIKPFDTLWINPDGSVCICCKNPDKISDVTGKQFNVINDKLSTIWESEHLQTIRQQFVNDEKPEGCKQCWDEESAGIRSLRLASTGSYFYDNQHIDSEILINSNKDNPVIRELNLTLTNKCNLACRICNPYASSLWAKEVKETENEMIQANSPLFNNYMKLTDEALINLESVKFQDDRLLQLYDVAKTLQKVYIYGGEPLLNEEILLYLQKMVDDGLSQEIVLVLNTNVTIYKDSIVELFSKFKAVELYLSIDGIDKEYEYQRWPARFGSIDRNIKRYAELSHPFNVIIYVTMSVLNIIDLEKMMDKLDSYNIPIDLYNQVHTPNILNIRNLPPDLKNNIINIIQNIDFSKYKNFRQPVTGHAEVITNFINLPAEAEYEYSDKAQYREDLMKFLSVSDNYRKTPMTEYLPNLYNLLF